MQLSDIQARFKDLMLDHPDALQKPDAALSDIFVHDDIPLPERLSIYRNNIVGGLSDTIKVTFPILKALVVDKFLEGMARAFILKNPPDVGCLNTYGRGFDDFIRHFEPAQSLPYLPDIARFEIAMNEAYYAPDQRALNVEELQSIPEDQLEERFFEICGYVALISSDYPLLAIQDFCEQEAPDGELDISQNSVKLMVTRPNIEVQIVLLQDDEHEMLLHLSERKPLGEAVKAVLGTHPDFDFALFLQKHIALETFAAFHTNK